MCIYMYMKIYIYHSPRAPQAHCCCAPHCSRHTLESGPHIYIHTYIYIHMPLATRATGALLCAITTYIYTHIYIYMYHSPRVLQALLCAITTCVCTHLYICMYRLPRALRARCYCGPRCSPPPLQQASEREQCHPHHHPQIDPRSSWSARRRQLAVVVLLLRAARLLRILKSQLYSCFLLYT